MQLVEIKCNLNSLPPTALYSQLSINTINRKSKIYYLLLGREESASRSIIKNVK